MGVAHHGSYLDWMEAGRTELLRALGISYREFEERGFMLPVAEVTGRYLAPARYDDMLDVVSSIAAVKRCSIKLDVRISSEGRPLFSGTTLHPCVGKNDGRICPLPEFFKDLVKPRESLPEPDRTTHDMSL
jgi:acyl-CoA thioester hydrolase